MVSRKSAVILLMQAAFLFLLVGDSIGAASVEPQNDPALFPASLKSALMLETDELKRAQAQAFQWLLAHRNTQWGWDPSTPEVIYALWSTNVTHTTGYIQSIKQLEIEIILHVCKGIPTTYLDRFFQESVLTMSSICWNPTDFHGYQLLDYFDGEMLKNNNFSAFSRARALYAACMGGMEIPASIVQQLLQNVAETPVLHEKDTLSQLALLLKCVLDNSASPAITGAVPMLLDSIKGNITEEISSKNVSEIAVTTVSLVVQALVCLENATGPDGVAEAGVLETMVDDLQRVLLQAQKADGSYGDNVLQTAQVLPGLSKTCLVNLKAENCARDKTEPAIAEDGRPALIDGDNVDPGEVLVFNDGGNVVVDEDVEDTRKWIRVNYTVWVGLLVDRAYSKFVYMKENTTMYQMMMVAAENDGRFEFATYHFPRGQYVHRIGDVELKHDGFHYWLLYILPFPPDPKNPPPTSFIGTKGIDDLILEDGMNILFWNKPI